MLNVLSVDVEDYFQVGAFATKIHYAQWNSFESRVERNMSRILEVFDKYGAKGTFFILGWVAEKFPHLPRQIAMAGHEIGCHGYAHQRLQTLTPDQFREDLKRATGLLSNQVQMPIRCYRAPSFSVVRNTMWALDVLADEGFLFDSSLFPVRWDHYGVPDGERFPYWQISPRGKRVFEFPPSTIRTAKNNWGVAGGGYLRLVPYGATEWAIRHINQVEQQPAMVYFHPWEIDPDQPVLEAGIRSRLRHYTNLRTMAAKIERLLQNFQFSTLSNVCSRHPAYRSEPAAASIATQPLASKSIARSAAAGA
jgi:polysaccharide deacetylase family protein (PEP-CTERM system associated)